MQECIFSQNLEKKTSCCRPDMVRGNIVYCRIQGSTDCCRTNTSRAAKYAVEHADTHMGSTGGRIEHTCPGAAQAAVEYTRPGAAQTAVEQTCPCLWPAQAAAVLFFSMEWNSENFYLPRKVSERNSVSFLFRGTAGIPSELTICSVSSVFRGIIILSEIANPTVLPNADAK
jgi:hypothetical protein